MSLPLLKAIRPSVPGNVAYAATLQKSPSRAIPAAVRSARNELGIHLLMSVAPLLPGLGLGSVCCYWSKSEREGAVTAATRIRESAKAQRASRGGADARGRRSHE